MTGLIELHPPAPRHHIEPPRAGLAILRLREGVQPVDEEPQADDLPGAVLDLDRVDLAVADGDEVVVTADDPRPLPASDHHPDAERGLIALGRVRPLGPQ